MGNHFVLLVDRLLTESTLEAAIENRNPSKQKVVECRICQDEDFDSKMETPCSCCGSLKYAHRRCVQRWCNEKGNTLCEICHQQFQPNYTAPPPVFQFGGIPMNLRGNWEIARQDLNNRRLITMVSTDHNFLDPTYTEYADSTSRSLICCRSVAAIFMVLLILRHTLPVIVGGSDNFSFPLFVLLLLRTSGIIVPVYIILRVVTAVHNGRRQQLQAPQVCEREEHTVHLPQEHGIISPIWVIFGRSPMYPSLHLMKKTMPQICSIKLTLFTFNDWLLVLPLGTKSILTLNSERSRLINQASVLLLDRSGEFYDQTQRMIS